MAERENPIERLIAKFKQAAEDKVTAVFGHVQQCDVLEQGGRKFFIVEVRNGTQIGHFAVEDKPHDPHFSRPKQGDLVKGLLDNIEEPVSFLGQSYKLIFDYENMTTDSERQAFEWFRNQPKNPNP